MAIDSPPAGQSRAGRVPGACGAGAAGHRPQPPHLRPHPRPAPGDGRGAAPRRGGTARARNRCPSPPPTGITTGRSTSATSRIIGLATGKPVYVISILENFSRALLASVLSPRQDLTAYLIVLRAAIEAHGAPEGLVSDGGGIFKAKQAQAIYRALGIAKHQIDSGPALAELHRNAFQRHAPHGRLPLRPGHDLGRAAGRARALLHRLQPRSRTPPTASGPKGRRSPAAVLGWVQGAWCDPADLDRLFRLRATRVLNAGGCGALPALAAVWGTGSCRGARGRLGGGRHADDRVRDRSPGAVPGGARGRRAPHPRGRPSPGSSSTGHASPQPFLAPLADVVWHPAQRWLPTARGAGGAGRGGSARRRLRPSGGSPACRAARAVIACDGDAPAGAGNADGAVAYRSGARRDRAADRPRRRLSDVVGRAWRAHRRGRRALDRGGGEASQYQGYRRHRARRRF